MRLTIPNLSQASFLGFTTWFVHCKSLRNDPCQGHLLDDRLGNESMDGLRAAASEVILELVAQVRRLDACGWNMKPWNHEMFRTVEAMTSVSSVWSTSKWVIRDDLSRNWLWVGIFWISSAFIAAQSLFFNGSWFKRIQAHGTFEIPFAGIP